MTQMRKGSRVRVAESTGSYGQYPPWLRIPSAPFLEAGEEGVVVRTIAGARGTGGRPGCAVVSFPARGDFRACLPWHALEPVRLNTLYLDDEGGAAHD
jgi:hypothetical protein